MGWFDRLLGRQRPKGESDDDVRGEALQAFAKRHWQHPSGERRVANTQRFLEVLGAALGVKEAIVVPRTAERFAELRGVAGDFPMTITADDKGRIVEIRFRYEDTNLAPLELVYDPGAAATTTTAERARDDRTIAPQIAAETGESAATFRELPDVLQKRVIGDLKRLRIRHFRSRREHFEITLHDPASAVDEPIRWLVDVMQLALEVSGARCAVAPGTRRPRVTAKPAGASAPTTAAATGASTQAQLAEAIAGQLRDARVVTRDAGDRVEVRWIEDGLPVRLVVDAGRGLHVQVRAEGAGGAFDLDGEAATATQHAALESIAPALRDELVQAIATEAIRHLRFADERLAATLGDLAPSRDAGAKAIRIAKLLARVAHALPQRAQLAP